MNNTEKLLEKLKELIPLMAGSSAGESETLKDVCELMEKVRQENKRVVLPPLLEHGKTTET